MPQDEFLPNGSSQNGQPPLMELSLESAKSYQENAQVYFKTRSKNGFWFFDRKETIVHHHGITKNLTFEPIEQSEPRRYGLGPFFNILPDSLIIRIFELLDEQDLCACSLVSKVFYIFAEEDELWKPLCLRKRGGDFLFQGSWKRACLFDHSQVKTTPYQRLSVPGFLSTTLYQRWYRANVPLSYWNHLEVQQIDRRSNLSLEEFIEEYDKKNKPVIITDVVDKWKASHWTKEYLLSKYGNFKFKTDEPNPRKKEKLYMNMRDYFEYSRLNHDEDPIYLFDDKLGEREEVKEILDDYEIPIYFREDFFQYLNEERPPYRWLVIGPERTGSPFHIDPYRSSAWNALLKGRKRWALFPYHVIPPGVDVDWEGGNFDVDAPEPIKWFVENYPYLPPNIRPIECILEEGELIFVPSGWWHMVLNLTETIAVTQNVCNKQNFETVCAELNFDDDEFYEEFQDAVRDAIPDIQFPTNLPTSGFKI